MSSRERIMLVVTTGALALSAVAFGLALDRPTTPSRVVAGTEADGVIVESDADSASVAMTQGGVEYARLERDGRGGRLRLVSGEYEVAFVVDAEGARLMLEGKDSVVRLEARGDLAQLVIGRGDKRIVLAADPHAATLRLEHAAERLVAIEAGADGARLAITGERGHFGVEVGAGGLDIDLDRNGVPVDMCAIVYEDL